jgi:hypothetical protein
MPAIEYPRTGESSGTKRKAIPAAETPEHSKRSGLCALSHGICQSRLRQFTNNDCPGGRKGN